MTIAPYTPVHANLLLPTIEILAPGGLLRLVMIENVLP
jgi:hypothetical protein